MSQEVRSWWSRSIVAVVGGGNADDVVVGVVDGLVADLSWMEEKAGVLVILEEKHTPSDEKLKVVLHNSDSTYWIYWLLLGLECTESLG